MMEQRALFEAGGSIGSAGKSVLELGSGCGLVGVFAARETNATHVVVSDFEERTVRNLWYNVNRNVVNGEHVDEVCLCV